MTWRPGQVLPPAALTTEAIGQILAALTSEQVLALTAWAEARSRLEPGRGWVENPTAAMFDVMSVVLNRTHDPRWRALGAKGVCLQRWAFSCWEPTGGADDPNDPDLLAENFESLMERAQLLASGKTPTPKLLACLIQAREVLGGRDPDRVGGATHYYAPMSMVPAGRVPKWVAGARFTVERWGHKFYAGVR